MPRKRGPRYPHNSSRPTQQPADSASSSHHESTADIPIHNLSLNPQTSDSSSPNPCNRFLPLGWNKLECYALSHLIHENCFDFEDSVFWWARFSHFIPSKSIKDFRRFISLYYQTYGELPPNPGILLFRKTEEGELPSGDETSLESIEAQFLVVDWTVKEKKKLMKLIEKKPSVITSRGCWRAHSGKFTGKTDSDFVRQVAKVKFDAVFMGNTIPEMKCLSLLIRHVEAVSGGDPEASTWRQPAVAREETRVSGNLSPDDSAPSTSGRSPERLFARSSFKSGKGGHHGSKRSSKR